jgi:DNA repair protein RadA/Sms
VSSVKGKPVLPRCVILGEVGLTGEVRSVSQIDRRVAEASRLGFDRFVVPASSRQALAKLDLPSNCDLYAVDQLTEAMDILFQ